MLVWAAVCLGFRAYPVALFCVLFGLFFVVAGLRLDKYP